MKMPSATIRAMIPTPRPSSATSSADVSAAVVAGAGVAPRAVDVGVPLVLAEADDVARGADAVVGAADAAVVAVVGGGLVGGGAGGGAAMFTGAVNACHPPAEQPRGCPVRTPSSPLDNGP